MVKRLPRVSKKKPAPKAKGTKRGSIRKRNGLTPIERLFCREYVMNGGNGKQAALAANITEDENYAGVAASELLKKPNTLAELDRLLSMQGLDDKTLAQGIWEGIRAFKVTWVEDAAAEGGYRSLVAPDFTARAKYYDMIAKLRGKYAPLRIEGSLKVGGVLEEICNAALANMPKEVQKQFESLEAETQ